MKRYVSLFLSLVMAFGVFASFPVTVNAAEASDLTFKFDGETSGYAVASCPTSAVGELVIPDTYNNKPVTIVGYDAFKNCTKLTSVTIPDSVVRIDQEAFYNCTSLSTVSFSSNLKYIASKAFYGCSYIQELNLPDSLEYIGYYSFAGVSVSRLTIPDNVKTIDDYAFYDCSLSSVDLGNSVKTIGDYAFAKNSLLSTIVISESLELIEANAFQDCKSVSKIHITDLGKWCNIVFENHYANPLVYCYNYYSKYNKYCYLYLNGSPVTDLVIPQSIEKIENNAFINYTHLNSVTLPDSIKSIGEDAFYGTDKMTAVYISDMNSWLAIDFGNGLANPLVWGDNAKLYLNGSIVTSVNVPDDITEIKSYAFYDCSTLEEIELNDNIEKIGASAFSGTGIYNNSENWENGLLYIGDCLVDSEYSISGECEIKDGTRIIAEEAFKDAPGLTSVKFPDTVSKISKKVFFNCKKLSSVELGDSVSVIEQQAFYECVNLASVNIGENVEEIGDWAFWGCSNLSGDFTFENIKHIGEEAFKNCQQLTSVKIKGNNVEIEDNAFEGCTGIKSVVLDGVETFGEKIFIGCTGIESVKYANVEKTGEYIFNGCDALSSVELPEGLKEISKGSFYGCGIEEIDFPQSLERIEQYAFQYCENLKGIVIGKNVNYIGDYAFVSCVNLADIKVYSTELDTHGMAFMDCPSVKYLYIDTSGALKNMPVAMFDGLETLSLGDGVTEIPEYKLQSGYFSSITIPKSVTRIGDSAFGYCHKLTTVNYGGSPKKWAQIEIGANNECLLNAELICAEHDHEPCAEWIVDFDSTCSQVGSQHNNCIICGIVLETEEIPLKEHNPGEWIIDTEPTVYKAGSKHTECSVCGATVETEEIPQLKASKPKLKTIENTEYGVLTKWSKVSGADSYRVYRKTSKGEWTYIGSTSKTYYTDKTAKSGTKYYYAVKSRNEAGNSSLSSSLSKLYLDNPTLKTPTSTSKGISLKWTKVAGAQGYIIYRKTGTGSYTRLKTEKGVSNLSYTDASAKKGKKYTYKVKAYYSKTYSAYSGTKTIKDKY